MATLTNTEHNIARGDVCPDCNSSDTGDNGEREYRCSDCGHAWGRDEGEWYGISSDLADKINARA